MSPVSSAYEQLLDAAIRHLEGLQSRGVRHVAVSAETLRALSLPATAPAVAPSHASPTLHLPETPTATRGNSVFGFNKSGTAASQPPPPIMPATKPVRSESKSTDAGKAAAFAELQRRVLACVQCAHLASARKTVVFGVGNIDSPLMFVGEAPGADEDEQGEPFVGKAGQLLTKIIETMGQSRADVYIANILKCRPDTPGQSAGNRKPTSDEMKTCIPYLHEQIDLIKPKVLVALGATAVDGLLGKTMGISKLRGNWQTYRGIPLMPTYHPAYLLRNQAMSEKRKVWEDMLQVMEKLEMNISDKQRKFFLKA
ncbi:MAG: uracil-DNA glycosylase [Verrucomicrobia bacterium]|nr:uracil-DNA glycosylase [Verrucomicrobiota bacterium]